MHPSQVSRIASGKFRRMEGHALRACKLALLAQQKLTKGSFLEPIETDLNVKVAKIRVHQS